MFNVQLPWKQIGYGMLIALIIGIFYYYVSYIPNKLEEERLKNKALQEQVEIDKKTVTLQTDTQKAKERIDQDVYAQLSTIRFKPVPHRTVIVPHGVRR